MKVQEVILRAKAKKIRWWQTAEIIVISDRSMRRWRERYERHGYDGLLDRRRGKPSGKRVPLAQAEQVLGLCREKYFDLNVRHFHEKLAEQHGITLSYTWVELALQDAGLVAPARRRRHKRLRRRRDILAHKPKPRNSGYGWLRETGQVSGTSSTILIESFSRSTKMS